MSGAARALLPTPQYLRARMYYDPASGTLTWRAREIPDDRKKARDARAWNTRYAGTPAICAPHGQGYRYGSLNGKMLLAHRVIWAIVHDEWPEEIDHINGRRDDNRIANLRSVCRAENTKNLKRQSRNTSGAVGVAWSRTAKAFVAQIGHAGRVHYLGSFSCREEALAARRNAERRFGFHPNHGRAT